jgi:CheY-like chemotaxis protein
MDEQRYRVLILDADEDTLITLQHVLEDAGVDTTITWDENEARQLVERTPFDLIVLGDHPPEIKADTILRDFNLHNAFHPCLILREIVFESDIEYFRQLGALAVIPKRDPTEVLEQVRKQSHLRTGDAAPPIESLAGTHASRAAA